MFIEADPYPWPYDGALEAHRVAFIICGAQRWFHARTDRPDAALDRIARIAAPLRPGGSALSAVRHSSHHGHQGGPVLPMPDWRGHELSIAASATDAVIDAA